MMTLLKYDFRKNWNTLLAGLVILIIAQIGQTLFLSGVTGNILGIMVYIGAGVAIYVKMIKTYTSNIRSYNRRLLPVTGLSHVLSPLIFGALCGLGLLIIGSIHVYLYTTMKLGIDLSTYINLSGMQVSDMISLLLFLAWIILFSLFIIFLSISIAGSFRWKTGPWIGIVAFLVLVNLISWLENIVLAGRFNPNELFQYTEESTGISITANGLIWSDGMFGSIIFELIVAVILVWATIYLNNKKVEV
ncbi:hypothetical protein C0Q44_17065 [Paenibacillus sp. PCH8]|uniref:hypothetical protein n=1 Tax=Paenibacillus sp. PCH8 TaxID=2066524 RepID=UPI000CF8B946|nr:hypothetical protein [Paenibacillus sp. PCH8]PQP83054.1 hypothetical protein C0Q44_17065 [Paenibacillus sp. PCH8]